MRSDIESVANALIENQFKYPWMNLYINIDLTAPPISFPGPVQ